MNPVLKRLWFAFGATMFIAFGGIAEAGPPPRVGPAHCTRHVVRPGDTASGIATKAHVPFEQIIALNGYIENLNQIWPLDEITLWCPPAEQAKKEAAPTTTIPAAPVAETAEAIQPATFECNPNGRKRWDGSDQCISPLPVIAGFLREAGFKGDSLVTMLAITLGESGGDPYQHGDTTITDHKWGDSVGWFQIRTVKAQRGTGSPRDEDALADPRHQAAAAWRISSGGTNFQPWSAFTNNSYRQFLDRARKAAQ